MPRHTVSVTEVVWAASTQRCPRSPGPALWGPVGTASLTQAWLDLLGARPSSMAVPCPHLVLPVFPGDLSGHVLAYLSLSPVFVIVGFVTLIIFKRELHTVSEFCSPRPHPREEGPPHPIPGALLSLPCRHLS